MDVPYEEPIWVPTLIKYRNSKFIHHFRTVMVVLVDGSYFPHPITHAPSILFDLLSLFDNVEAYQDKSRVLKENGK